MNKFFVYVYFYSVHVSGNYVPIIRRTNCINAIPGICNSVWTTMWYADLNGIPTCITGGRPRRVTYTRYRIDTVNSPDHGHIVARNV